MSPPPPPAPTNINPVPRGRAQPQGKMTEDWNGRDYGGVRGLIRDLVSRDVDKGFGRCGWSGVGVWRVTGGCGLWRPFAWRDTPLVSCTKPSFSQKAPSTVPPERRNSAGPQGHKKRLMYTSDAMTTKFSSQG